MLLIAALAVVLAVILSGRWKLRGSAGAMARVAQRDSGAYERVGDIDKKKIGPALLRTGFYFFTMANDRIIRANPPADVGFTAIAVWLVAMLCYVVWEYRQWRDRRSRLAGWVKSVAPMRVTIRGIAIVAIVAAVSVSVWFIWPTPYRAVQLPSNLRANDDYMGCCYAARANRFTATIQVLGTDGWHSLKN